MTQTQKDGWPCTLYILAREGEVADQFDPWAMRAAYTYRARSMPEALALAWPTIERDQREAGQSHRGGRIELQTPTGQKVANFSGGLQYQAAQAPGFTLLTPARPLLD